MINVKFPETNYVGCKFTLRQSNDGYTSSNYDKRDHRSGSRLKQYVYAVPEYLQGDLQVGDFVLVHCQTGYQMCEVTETNAIVPDSFVEGGISPVICKCDLKSYFEEIEKKERLDYMRKQIYAEKKRLESLVTFDLIAEKNPEFKEMLDAFRDAGGSL